MKTIKLRVLARRALLATVLVGAASLAGAASFGLSPMRVELSAAARTAVVEVTNSDEAPVTIQVQPRAWRQADGKDVQEDTKALIVNPPIFTVKPQGRQLVRIALRTAPAPRIEQSFRLIFAEVPTNRVEHTPTPGFTFHIAMRMDIPLYVAPLSGKPAPTPSWSITANEAASRLRIGNEGNGNLRLTQLKVTQAEHTLAEVNAIVVLPGAFRVVELTGKLTEDPVRVQALQGTGKGEALDFTLPPAVR